MRAATWLLANMQASSTSVTKALGLRAWVVIDGTGGLQLARRAREATGRRAVSHMNAGPRRRGATRGWSARGGCAALQLVERRERTDDRTCRDRRRARQPHRTGTRTAGEVAVDRAHRDLRRL